MIALFERNFDTENQHPRTPETRAAAEAAEAAAALKEQLDAARQEGFDAGRRVGMQDAQAAFDTEEVQKQADARKAIQEQLGALLKADDNLRRETERDIVELFCGIAERLVPELLEIYGIDLAIGRIRQSLEQARTDPVLSIRACPDVIGVLKCDAPEWLSPAADGVQIDLQADAKMNRGALRVQWSGGRFEYDLHAACLEMLQALAQAAAEYEEDTEKAG